MKNYNQLIVDYLDDQLSEKERITFEKELQNNDALQKEFLEFKKVREVFSAKNITSPDHEYFNTVVPRFRQSLEKNTRSHVIKKVGYVFTFLIITLAAYLVFQYYFFNQVTISDPSQLLTDDLSQDEINYLADYVSDDSQELLSEGEKYHVLDDIDYNLEDIAANFSSEEKLLIINDYKINDLYSVIDDKEGEYAYNELISKRIF